MGYGRGVAMDNEVKWKRNITKEKDKDNEDSWKRNIEKDEVTSQTSESEVSENE